MIIKNKKSAQRKRHVHFDTYGNAVPNVPSTKIKGSALAATIVETREVLIKPKKNSIKKTRDRAPGYTKKPLMQRLLSWTTKPITTLPAVRTNNSDKIRVMPESGV